MELQSSYYIFIPILKQLNITCEHAVNVNSTIRVFFSSKRHSDQIRRLTDYHWYLSLILLYLAIHFLNVNIMLIISF